MDWKDTMETPDGKGQEQGGDMVTDHTSSDTKKAAVAVKSSNSISQSPESPREGHETRKPVAMIWESHHGVGRYGLVDRRMTAGWRKGGKAKEESKPTLAKTDVIQNSASDCSTIPALSYPVNGKKLPSTTALSGLEGGNAAEIGDAPLEPPVTKEVLAELEIAMVINNPKFRHDFNFGCGIPYVPKETKHKSDEFWRVLRLQISELWLDREAFIAKHPGNAWTLPILLKAIGEILASLLPQRESSVIKETLDVDLLMQQLIKGQLSLDQLADWLSGTLRRHCAPMRDCDVFKMAEKLTVGFQSGDVESLVDGLVVLLTTLEAMRLDVTNHQINHLTLIHSFVHFQQSKILRIIQKGDIDIYGSYAWFDSYRIPDVITALSREGGIWKFFRAFVDLLRHSNREAPTPDTLELDSERIADLRTKLLNAVNIHICMSLFKVIDETITSPQIPAREGRIHASSQVQSDSGAIERRRRLAHLRFALLAIVDDCSNPNIDPTPPPTSSAANFDRWKVAVPTLTLELLRNASAPLHNPYLEKTLAATLSNPSNQDFQRSECAVFGRLGVFVEEYVDAWKQLDSVDLYKVAPVCSEGCKIHAKPEVIECLDEIARRITHLGILHWNVWGKIVYLVNRNEHHTHSRDRERDTVELTNGS
ncbi:hypothetical protein V493_03630 [Pseudogymnoascus sp. VKM F-4281 (FW-2241)]|nr:hypothetical protein V493_03630 [Pseudogymnoascus sp. VKM F-4281 (FW-2241)]